MPNSQLRDGWYRLVVSLFVDSVWLHRWWGCHRRADRSFSIRGRQLHVCARCTGLLSGVPLSCALLPWRARLPALFGIFLGLLVIDGATQLWGWRESTNELRFLTGLGTS